MNTNSINTRNSIKELFFIIAPPRHIISDVSVLKDDVHYLTGRTFNDRFSKAHISLFKYHDKHLDDMIDFVEEKACEFKPFNVFVKDFGAFHHGSSRTIYMDIVNKYPIRDIFEKLIKGNTDFIPHITIARNISDEDFLKSWPYLASLRYSQHFTCDCITVLARSEKRWIHYKDIPFADHV